MSRTVILWAGNVADSSGIPNPEGFLGEPDALLAASLYAPRYATLTNFRGRYYRDLSALLGAAIHNPVAPDVLATADLIAFEGNSGSPASSGGWESCEWFFGDGVNALSVHWDEAVGFVDPTGHIVGNGSITGAAYSAFFGFPTANFMSWDPRITRVEDIHPEALVVSFLLIRLRPEIDTASPYLKVRISGSILTPEPRVRECSPDPDAIGIIACHH